jgi:hypothetical protein
MRRLIAQPGATAGPRLRTATLTCRRVREHLLCPTTARRKMERRRRPGPILRRSVVTDDSTRRATAALILAPPTARLARNHLTLAANRKRHVGAALIVRSALVVRALPLTLAARVFVDARAVGTRFQFRRAALVLFHAGPIGARLLRRAAPANTAPAHRPARAAGLWRRPMLLAAVRVRDTDPPAPLLSVRAAFVQLVAGETRRGVKLGAILLVGTAPVLRGTDPIPARRHARSSAMAVFTVATGCPAPLAANAVEIRVRHTSPVPAHLALSAGLTAWGQRWGWR